MADSGSTTFSPAQAQIVASVRKQAVWAAIAAGMMLYFGFTVIYIGDSFATDLLKYTLQVGGVAMALSAVLLFTGWPMALMLDGVFAMVIGIALALAGTLMIVGERVIIFEFVLYIVFGYLFFTSGLRSFRDFCRLGEDSTPVDYASESVDAVTAEPMGATPMTPDETPSAEPHKQAPTPEGFLAQFGDEERDDATK